jgi:6,7-dimethyl-8-ribityllumazine synthase
MSTEISGVDGTLPEGEIYVVASRYNEGICDELVKGAVQTLQAAGYDDAAVTVVRVPGAWELPAVASHLASGKHTIGVIALGCVIKGETTHDQHINRAVSDALMKLGMERRLPIGFGLLTCNTLEQAINRSGGTVGNKGVEAAQAVLEMLRLYQKLS